MEEVSNLTLDDVLELITEFPVQPLGRKMIISMNVDEYDGELVLSENSFSESQYVIAVGDHIHNIKPGMKVLLDLEKMTQYVPSETNQYDKVPVIKVKPVQVDGRIYALISDAYVDAIDNRD